MRPAASTDISNAAAPPLADCGRDGEWAAACAYAQELVQVYFRMLTVGCAASACANPWCASNPTFARLSAEDAAIRSILLATSTPVPICATLGGQRHRTMTPVESTRALTLKPEEQPETTEHDAEEANNAQEHQDQGDPAPAAAAEADKRPCTPRRRLSTAMGIAQELDAADNNDSNHHAEASHQTAAPPAGRQTPDERGQPRRRMSFTKQKLMDAIKGSFARRGSKKTRSSETRV